MSASISSADAIRLSREYWDIASSRIAEERVHTTTSERMRQFIALQAAWPRQHVHGDDRGATEARDRWMRLREFAERTP